jgi:hypothetical protein
MDLLDLTIEASVVLSVKGLNLSKVIDYKSTMSYQSIGYLVSGLDLVNSDFQR